MPRSPTPKRRSRRPTAWRSEIERPTPGEVRRIAAIADPVVRNLEITHCYSRLAAAYAARSGEGANWCTYATWASRQAGRTIRGEDLLEHFGSRLGAGRWLLHPLRTLGRRLLRRGLLRPETRLGRLTAGLHTPFDAFERASAAVARGNLRVFAEIGLEFARYLECGDDGEAAGRFLEGLRRGEPPDGQRYLRQAFERYEQARVERDPKRRAELAVLANLEIGLHEQARLQPEIRAAVDAAYATHDDLMRRVGIPRLPVAVALQRAASRVAREAISECLMVLSLPGRVLMLGAHLADSYPEALHEPALPELIELLARFEPAPPARDDCGARDWSDFDQRMHYIAHLFRAFHLDRELAKPPFTQAQVVSFGRGLVPDGEL